MVGGATADEPRETLHIVSGKGGTGKTTIAGALACALATEGRRVLLCEVEGRHGISELFGVPPLVGDEERRLRRTPAGGVVHGLSIDAEDALLEYLDTFYHLGLAGQGARQVRRHRLRHLDRARAARRAAHRQGLRGRPPRDDEPADAYDAVVLDAPPTGRIASSSTCTRRCRGWPRWARSAARPTRSCACCAAPRTVVHLVTLLEDMPVTETEEAIRPCDRPGSRSAA